MKNYLFTSESVSEGHPDKMADQISDGVLDAILSQDPTGRVAAETMITTGMAIVSGEISTKCYVEIPEIVRKTVKEIGYDHSEKGFDYNTCAVLVSIDQQSPDIAMGVDEGANKEQGAGDQGIMFGYAINETPELMPLTISLSHKLVQNLASKRKTGAVDFLRPDSKSQVTFEYVDGKPTRVDSVVISTQHSPDVTQNQIKEFIIEDVIKKTIDEKWMDAKTKFIINPTGKFVIGGPQGDCGLTGRKIIVDTYGGHGAHGGGAFSGKDPSKVDRSAAYAGRHIAKNIVAAGLADRCLVQLAYAIGVAEPVSIMVDGYGTGKVSGEDLAKAVRELWGLKPSQIVKDLDLLKPRYRPTAAYGHFGREEDSFTWEKLDKVDALKNYFSL
ncbi:MAG: methionine adenosyltransferase [Bdellovibrionales bacterium]|nr:methionine adenosyltransferase [Bdellovibrionales bacterium]